MDLGEVVSKRMVLTPAEKAVVLEQMDTLDALMHTFRCRVKDNNATAYMEQYELMTGCMQYVYSIFTQKAHGVLHDLQKEGGL